MLADRDREGGSHIDHDPIRGKTLRFSFDDGAMAGKTFEHTFDADGTVTFRMRGAKRRPESSTMR